LYQFLISSYVNLRRATVVATGKFSLYAALYTPSRKTFLM
jgi:hypothetical protein